MQITIHVCAVIGKIGALVMPVAMSTRYRLGIIAVLGAIQLAAGAIAQGFNTDGTPQEAAYLPPDRLAVKGGSL